MGLSGLLIGDDLDRLQRYDFVVEAARLLGREVSDGVIAPDYDPEALDILKKKKIKVKPNFIKDNIMLFIKCSIVDLPFIFSRALFGNLVEPVLTVINTPLCI